MNEEKKALFILNRLRDNGHEAFIAGGAARDILSGQTPSDFDVITDASFEQIKELFKDRKCAVVGISFKICIVDGVEVATYRKGLPFGDDSRIERAESLIEDLSRRDLTINAMAYCPVTREVVDPFRGREDLKQNIIRFTGNPLDRITEDPCRIIRACRFKAKLQGVFDPESLETMKTLAHRVNDVAPERLRLELIKALTLDYPSLFFNALRDIGTLPLILPGLAACYGHEGGRHHAETLDVHQALVGDALPKRKPLLRLAGYLHDIGKPPTAESHENGISFYGHEKVGTDIVEQELKALTFSLKEIHYVASLVRHHMRSVQAHDKPKTIRRVLKKLNDDGVSWKDWLRLKIADKRGNLGKNDYSPEHIKGMVMAIRNSRRPESGTLALTVRDLAVSGRDVKDFLGIEPGPRVGEILDALLAHVVDHPEDNKRGALIVKILEVGKTDGWPLRLES